MKEIYICDYCGKQFENNQIRCKIHELNCEKNPTSWILIRVTCASAIKDMHPYICDECCNDTCVDRVQIENRKEVRDLIKMNEPYDYTNEYHSDGFSSGRRQYISVKDPNFTFTAKHKILV